MPLRKAFAVVIVLLLLCMFVSEFNNSQQEEFISTGSTYNYKATHSYIIIFNNTEKIEYSEQSDIVVRILNFSKENDYVKFRIERSAIIYYNTYPHISEIEICNYSKAVFAFYGYFKDGNRDGYFEIADFYLFYRGKYVFASFLFNGNLTENMLSLKESFDNITTEYSSISVISSDFNPVNGTLHIYLIIPIEFYTFVSENIKTPFKGEETYRIRMVLDSRGIIKEYEAYIKDTLMNEDNQTLTRIISRKVKLREYGLFEPLSIEKVNLTLVIIETVFIFVGFSLGVIYARAKILKKAKSIKSITMLILLLCLLITNYIIFPINANEFYKSGEVYVYSYTIFAKTIFWDGDTVESYMSTKIKLEILDFDNKTLFVTYKVTNAQFKQYLIEKGSKNVNNSLLEIKIDLQDSDSNGFYEFLPRFYYGIYLNIFDLIFNSDVNIHYNAIKNTIEEHINKAYPNINIRCNVSNIERKIMIKADIPIEKTFPVMRIDDTPSFICDADCVFQGYLNKTFSITLRDNGLLEKYQETSNEILRNKSNKTILFSGQKKIELESNKYNILDLISQNLGVSAMIIAALSAVMGFIVGYLTWKKALKKAARQHYNDLYFVT